MIIYNGFDKQANIYRFTELNSEEEILRIIKIPKNVLLQSFDENGNVLTETAKTYANKDEALAAYLEANS